MRQKATFADKLSGRLVLVEHAPIATKAVARTAVETKYGKKLAVLVENGNKAAIKLLSLLQKRDRYKSEFSYDMAILESFERPIAFLGRKLGLDLDVSNDLLDMIKLATSNAGFDSQKHFKTHLCEGLLLNINALASQVLSIPCGEYMVYMTNPGHTMLVPTEEVVKTGELFNETPQKYDLHTPELVGCWNKLERIISEKTRKATKASGEGQSKKTTQVRSGREIRRDIDERGGPTKVAGECGIKLPTLVNIANNNGTDGETRHISADVLEKLVDCGIEPSFDELLEPDTEFTPYSYDTSKKPQKSKSKKEKSEVK